MVLRSESGVEAIAIQGIDDGYRETEANDYAEDKR